MLAEHRVLNVAEYRVYKLNPAQRIVAGEWIEADGDEDALRVAQALCDAATPWVEIWQRHRKVAMVPCEPHARSANG
jgi:hypothetical protein